MDATRRLGGENFNFWGGPRGLRFPAHDGLENEREHAAMFFKMARDYWVKDLKQKGKPLLIEPKPQEPSKHQYDWDVGTTAGFLREFGLEKDFRLNVECNHATLAGHSCSHEIETAVAMDMLGGLDANTGDPQVGWDTDQFMTDGREAALVLSRDCSDQGLRPGRHQLRRQNRARVHRRQRPALRAHRRHGRHGQGSEAGGQVGWIPTALWKGSSARGTRAG